MREFGFEMALCGALEAEGELVARQLGASTRGKRVVDALLVEPGPAFDERTAITSETIPGAAVDADVGVGRWRPERAVRSSADLPAGDHGPDPIDAAVEAGFLERGRRDGRRVLRQTARYPERWFGRLTAVENKPELGRPGELATQLRRDVSLAAVDAVVLCTASHVTGAHRNRIPDGVGIWRFDPESGERSVLREPDPLPVEEPGLEILERRPGRTEVATVTAERKARLRRRLAERAYGKGWRVPPPACPNLELRTVGGVGPLPYCTREERVVGGPDRCGCDAGSGGEPPAVDLAAARAAHSPWVRDPDGGARRQSGLDRFR
jgi:hypothetical protein